jgi:hypothetical protein
MNYRFKLESEYPNKKPVCQAGWIVDFNDLMGKPISTICDNNHINTLLVLGRVNLIVNKNTKRAATIDINMITPMCARKIDDFDLNLNVRYGL